MVAVALANTLFFSVPLGEARDKVGLYLALTMAPFAVLSPLVGPALDRRPGMYRLAIIAAGAGRVVVAVLLATRTEDVSLYPLAFLLLVLSRVHGVSRSALVPDTVPETREPMWGNAWLAVISVVAAAVGAAVAAGANAVSGPGLALWIAAAVFAALTVPAARLPRPVRGPEKRVRVGDYRALLSSRLLAGGLAMAANRAAVGFLTFLIAFLVRRAGEDAAALALIIGAAGVGGFVGSAAAPALRALLRESLLLLVSLAAVTAVALWAAGDFEVSTAAVVAFVTGLSSGTARLAFDSLLQNDAPETIRGRAFARYETVFQLCWVAGAGLATAVPFRPAGGMRTLGVISAVGLGLSVRGLVRRTARLASPSPGPRPAQSP
jgi:hypothetical protein